MPRHMKQKIKCPFCEIEQQLFKGKLVDHYVNVRDVGEVKCAGSGKKMKSK
jgi:predicted hydrocarbon binding protein